MLERVIFFIQDKIGIDAESAAELHARYYSTYGTSVVGLKRHHDIDPVKFLSFVHDIDIGSIPHDYYSENLLGMLPGRSFVFTNGSEKHARRILSYLGIESIFDRVFGIECSNFIAKPDPDAYKAMIGECDVDPSRAVMFDDREINLIPASDLGMRAVLISDHGRVESRNGIVSAPSIPAFLNELRNLM
jgi:putative hydrolase of the HAD superfamily